MQRMYEEKRLQMERGSIGGSYFMVQLPDGSMEKRMKMPINIDPGVHSSLNLDQLAAQSGGLHPVATLPTITESKANETETGSPEETPTQSQNDARKRPPRPHRNSESDSVIEFGAKNIPRNASQPAFTSHHQGMQALIFHTLNLNGVKQISESFAPGIPKNGSVPTFDRVRKTSTSERFKPSLAAIKASSRGEIGSAEVWLFLLFYSYHPMCIILIWICVFTGNWINVYVQSIIVAECQSNGSSTIAQRYFLFGLGHQFTRISITKITDQLS